MNDSATVAQLIRERMKAYGISNKQLADDIQNVNVNTIAQLAKGREISYVTFAKIADYLDCSVDYLLGRVDNPQLNDSTYINGNNNNNGNQAINGNININTNTTEKDDRQLLEMIKSLDLIQRAKIITAIDKIRQEGK